MKNRLLAAALAFCTAVGFVGCAQKSEGYTSSSGTLGISRDDALLYAADSDSDQVIVVDAKTNAPVANIKVGRNPERLTVGPDDTIYVANRFERSVSVIRRGAWSEAAKIQVGVEPVALAVSADGKTLYVVNATSRTSVEFGTLMAIDTTTLAQKWELPVGFEPRALALLDGEKAMVSLYKDGDVVMVDLKNVKVTRSGSNVKDALNATVLNSGDTKGGGPTPQDVPAPGGSGGGSGNFNFAARTFHPRGVEALAVTPDGRQVFAAALLSSQGVLGGGSTVVCNGPDCFDTTNVDPTVSSGGYGGGATCNGGGAVASPALLTFDAEGTATVDDVGTCVTGPTDHPPTVLSSGNSTLPIQGPSAVVIDPTGAFAFVANRESNNVAIVSAAKKSEASVQNGSDVGVGADAKSPGGFFGSGSVQSVVSVGAGPSGLALARDGARAWVYSSFDHTLSRIESKSGVLQTVATVKVAEDVLPADVVAGRKLFFSATDSRMNNLSTGISCGTCHLDGREDGHVWNFPDGPRQTPSLAGRLTMKTAPFHWNGEHNDLASFMAHTVQRRMGGSGVTPAMEKQLAAFIGSIPAADNPLKPVDGELNAQQVRGAQAFAKAECNSCHSGEALTDNKFAAVGTYVTTGGVQDNMQLLPKGLNTPSLLNVARTAPYLHDGSALTLKARIIQGKSGDQHGKTSRLSDAEVNDLISYLETL